MAKPSSSNFFRKEEATFLSFLVSVGRSKKTKTHKLRYWLSREKLFSSIFGVNDFPADPGETLVQGTASPACRDHQGTLFAIYRHIYSRNTEQLCFDISSQFFNLLFCLQNMTNDQINEGTVRLHDVIR